MNTEGVVWKDSTAAVHAAGRGAMRDGEGVVGFMRRGWAEASTKERVAMIMFFLFCLTLVVVTYYIAFGLDGYNGSWATGTSAAMKM